MNALRKLRRGFKERLGLLLGWILGGRFIAGPKKPIPERINKILVIRIDERVGNVLLTTPLLTALERFFPDAQLDVLVAASKASILKGQARAVLYDKKSAFVRPLEYLRGLWRLRRARYDVAIDASHWHHFSLSSAALLSWTAAPLRIAHARGAAHLFATALSKSPPHEPEIKTKLRLIEPLGLEPGAFSMSTALGTSPAAQEKIEAWLKEKALLDRPLVGLNPGSRKLDHRAPEEIFSALGRLAKERLAQPVVLWGPGEEALAERVARASGALLAPGTNLDELAAFMRRCTVVVANDTGPMHLSVACGASTIALFKSADPIRWGHKAPSNAVIVLEGRALSQVLDEAKASLTRLLDKNID